MLRFLSIGILAFLSLSISACSEPNSQDKFIMVDQFGYLPDLEKRAVIKNPKQGFDSHLSFSPGDRYAVIDVQSGEAVFEGAPVAWKAGKTDDASGDQIWWFDFSELSAPGQYLVRDLSNGAESHVFEISNTVYEPVLKAAFKTFYLQRAGFEKRTPFVSGAYADGASHLRAGQDTEARLFNAKNDARTARDLRGGWYDAGDYNKYTSWTANYVTLLLSSYLENPAIWTDDFGIPESGNGVPDILDEVKWGLDWLERMQNENGSMLSVMSLAEASPPSKATGPSFYGPENTSATVTSAGAFAMAAKVFGDSPALKQHSERYKRKALKAWAWAEANPNVTFYNNDEAQGSLGLAAGQQEVDAERLRKKRLIASVHLYSLTNTRKFQDIVSQLYDQIKPMAADTPNAFEGHMAFEMLYFARQKGIDRRFRNRIKRDYERNLLNAYNAWPVIANGDGAYGAYVDGYWWGSNSTKARRGSVYTQAVLAGVGEQSNQDYLNAAKGYLHYIHGVNPLGKVYLSNMKAYGAENSANSFYHAWFKDGSEAFDDVQTSKYGPAPGFLVGGPNPGYDRDPCCADMSCGGYGKDMCELPILSPPTGQPPAKSYADFNEGWPLNSWSVTENSNSYQVAYIRLLSKFVR